MNKKIRVLDITKDAETAELHDGLVISRRLIRKAHGSDVSFHVTSLHKGYDDQHNQYPEQEIVYMLSGTAEIEFDGEKHLLKPGMALLVPHGLRYGYRVIDAPNEVLVVFSPARY